MRNLECFYVYRKKSPLSAWSYQVQKAYPAVLVLMFSAALLGSCSQKTEQILAPIGDIRPPSIVSAGPKDSGLFEICFNEEVDAVDDTFGFQPEPTVATPQASGSAIEVALSPPVKPGENCTLSGEARDAAGNITRFLFSFVGFNDSPAALRINELQCGKNTSASNLHRDYIEFVVQRTGNLGGEVVRWASSVKSMEYRFPSADVKTGEIILLHLSPEGLPEEKDEIGQNLALSGGIDSSNSARDFWTSAGGLADSTGIIAVYQRDGAAAYDGICYVEEDKSGTIENEAPLKLAKDLKDNAEWPFAATPKWEDGFLWKSSTSRPIHRLHDGQLGPSQWFVGESGSQSPGQLEPSAKNSTARKSKSAATTAKKSSL